MATALDLQIQTLTFEDVSLNPGLFHLSLNLLFQPDSETLNERREALNISLKDEHITTHMIIRNMIAMINYRLPRRQNEVRKTLENIKEENPYHLNTLANLEVIYKELHRQKDADQCKTFKDRIMDSNDPKDIERKARCLLEQGYALLVEEFANHEGVAGQKLRDSVNILENELEKSYGDRKEHLGRALRQTRQALLSVTCSMGCSRPNEAYQRKIESIKRFQQGLKMMIRIGKGNEIEYFIWNYYLGKAYNRFDYSVYEDEDTETKNKTREKLIACALQKFWETIVKLSSCDGKKLYIGRSYAFIGHILVSRKDLANKSLSTGLSPCYEDPEFKSLLDTPIKCFEKAIALCPDDSHILKRYGRSLRNLALETDILLQEKCEFFTRAEQILSNSIEVSPENNWFAYSTRMQTRRDLAFLDKGNTEEWLMKARSDGIKLVNSKVTAKDLKILAKICQHLAKFPYHERFGLKFVKNRDLIHEAIYYLNYALQQGGFAYYHVCFTLASCLFESGEHRPAVEWMKRAMDLSKPSGGTKCLTCIGEYIFDLYRIKTSEGVEGKDYLFEELWFVIKVARSKYSNIEKTLKTWCKYQHEEMVSFLKFLITATKLDELGRETVTFFLDELAKWNTNDDRRYKSAQLEEQLRQLPPLMTRINPDLPRDSVYTMPYVVMPLSIDTTVHGCGYEYDFFVSHSNVNKDWVNGYLLHQLETKLHDDDIAFKGCIADRNFKPGETIINNIVDAVGNSYKILLIITPDFIKSRWCDYEIDRALADMLKKKKDNCVIPILLEEIHEGEYPEKLRGITYLDLTKTKDHYQEIMKLKRALLSED